MERIKDMRVSPDRKFLVTISSEGKIGFWDPKKLMEYELELAVAKPQKVVKSNHRLLCVAINHLGGDKEEKKLKKNKNK